MSEISQQFSEHIQSFLTKEFINEVLLSFHYSEDIDISSTIQNVMKELDVRCSTIIEKEKDRMRVLKHFKPQFVSLIKDVVQKPSNDFLKPL
ncbi:MAG TPA: hypothetical protein PK151_05235 [Caldisericia bacterium]|jgi:hypothetical protein|nr:hypothetical protein [Caldisericia bacterium]